jgi:hypothetical protein
MKKFAVAALAAVIATVSLSATAEAGWRFRNHGWHGRVFFAPRIVVRPARFVVVRDYCFTRKVWAYDNWGNAHLRRVRVCR